MGIEKIGRKIARIIDQEVRELGLEPNEFYRKNKLSQKIYRIRSAKSFTCNGIEEIVNKAEKESCSNHPIAV